MKNLMKFGMLILTVYLIILTSVGCSDDVSIYSNDKTVLSKVTLVEERENYTYKEGIHDDRPWNATRIKIINALPHLPQKVISTPEQAITTATEAIKQQSKSGTCPYDLCEVFYDTEDQVWIVTYTEPDLEPGTFLGGCYEVAISKNNGKVLEIWAGE